MTMDVLVAPVGDQDPTSPKNAQPGSILTLAAKLRPALIYLLPTRLPAGLEGTGHRGSETFANAVHTREQLELLDFRPAVEIIELVVAKPNLPREILPEMERAAARIRQECAIYDEPVTMHVSAASGTPTIKLAAMLLVSGGA